MGEDQATSDEKAADHAGDHTGDHAEDHGALAEWRERPFALAGLLAIAGLFTHIALEVSYDSAWGAAVAAALIFGSLAAAFTLSPQNWKSACIYAGGVALVMAGIAWRAMDPGDHYSDEAFWVAAGILAITLSVPLFQADFHKHRWATSYKDTHFHVWTDAITGAGALAFTGLSWLLFVILGELFRTIQIDILYDLLDYGWFRWIFAGATFGAALGVLRNQLKIIGTLQNVVLLVLSILAVPLAIALVLFLLSVLVSGIDVLWEATRSATPLLLAIAVGCFVLSNAVVRDDDADTSRSKVLRLAGFVLALGILPLAVMASISMGTRIAQHGLSPERLWALVAIAVAVGYGVAYFVSAIRGRKDGWKGYLRQSNLHLAVVTSVIAFVLAMPIFNFGSISASNQLARLESGAVSAEEFDYRALRWEFGDAGEKALAQLAESDDAKVAEFAKAAQDADSRWGTPSAQEVVAVRESPVEVEDEKVEAAVRIFLEDQLYRCRDRLCRVVQVGEHQGRPLMVLAGGGNDAQFLTYDEAEDSVRVISIRHGSFIGPQGYEVLEVGEDPVIELRPYVGQQLYIDGEPASAPFE